MLIDTDLCFTHLDTDQALQVEARLNEVRRFMHGESRFLSYADESPEAIKREIASRSALGTFARTRSTTGSPLRAA
ncbi:hypothetical protein [Aquimonas sp.]|jgi:hypothetical protein|uniref:hypothetical protein n=1 Tax=Aquimonas sp. TaxID=1872588 RepID=UPI0037BF539F